MRRVLVAGLLGGTVMIVWFVVADGILGFRRGIDVSQLAEERAVYAFLAEHVPEPGRYICNPEALLGQGFPGDLPIFAVQYSGLGHADAGREVAVGLAVMLLAPIAGAWLLANASSGVLSRYGSRVAFLAVVGVVVALLGVGARFGIAAYPLADALALAVHDLAAWVLCGFAVARFVRPVSQADATRAG